jgi:CheY-like chemotaxis protein
VSETHVAAGQGRPSPLAGTSVRPSFFSELTHCPPPPFQDRSVHVLHCAVAIRASPKGRRMTVVRYRCEHRAHIERELERAPVRTERRRLGRAGAAAGPLRLYVPRALTRPDTGRRAATAQPPRALASEMGSAPASSGDRRERALHGLRVLCVEDDNDARELVSIILRNAGALVECAASAAHGFDLIHNGHPQLLVSDIGMPDEDGYSLMRRIRALQCCEGGDMLSIALSAFTRPEDRMLALRAGFTIHIAKPVQPSHLVAAVATLAALIHGGRQGVR